MSIVFNGTTQCAFRSAVPDPSSFVMAGWFRRDSATGNKDIWASIDDGSFFNQSAIQVSAGGVSSGLQGSNESAGVSVATVNEWQWFMFRFTGGTRTLRHVVDGGTDWATNVATSALSAQVPTALTIGAQYGAGTPADFASMTCALFKVWSGATLPTDAEVLAERLSTAATVTTGLWARYVFATGALGTDDGGSARTLTLTGTPTFTADKPTDLVTAAAPTFTSIAPTSGVVGTTITGTLTNGTGATGARTANSIALTGFTLVSPTEFTGVIPTGATTGAITLLHPSGNVVGPTFTVTVPPTITLQPAATTVVRTDPARASRTMGIAATTSGSGMSAQWYRGASGVTTDPINTGGVFTVTTTGTSSLTSTLAIAPGDNSLNGVPFWCRVTDSVGSTNSAAAVLTVKTGIVLSPTSGVTNGSGVATLTAVSDLAQGSGEVCVIRTNVLGASSRTALRFTQPAGLAPTISGFSPSSGPVGTIVGISGANFNITPGATTVSFNGTAAVTVNVASSSYLTTIVPTSATTGLITVTTSNGSGSSATAYTVGAVSTSRSLSRTNPNTGVTTSVEYARGVSSEYDVQINETTGTIMGTLWNWAAERVGAARHAAIPGGQRITITTTGAQGWTDFKAAVITARAGTGDWEIVLPTSAPLTQDQQYDLTFPAGRRLYLTAATLQTADTMTSLAGAFATFDGPDFQRAYQMSVQGAGNHITFTGIRWRARAEYANANLLFDNDAAVTVADMPREIVMDRFWIDGNDRNDGRRGMRVEVQRLALLEGWITDISLNAETTGIHAWDGAGFQYMRNVYSEAAGIGIMYGADAPTNATFIPHDILCYRVAMAKREKWMPGVQFDGRSRTIKNNWECKKVKRWTNFECVSVNHRGDLGQSNPMVLKNGNPGGLDTTQDVVFLRHDFYRTANGYSQLGRGTEETTDLTRVAIVDIRYRELGYWNQGGATQPWSLQGPCDGFIYDRVTEIISTLSNVGFGHPFYGSGGNSRNVWIGNVIKRTGAGLAGGPSSFTEVLGTEGLRTGWAQAANSYVGGMVFYGPDALFNKATSYPDSTEYASEAAAGINPTTGALTGDITTRGIGGSTPGANITALDAMVAAMSWAYGR